MKIFILFGTRPEAIKLSPLIKIFKEYKTDFEVKVCVTSQHREMLYQVLNFFDIKPDYDLNIMKPDQSLFDITANGLKELEHVLNKYEPDLVFVQGDTTTTFIGALAGYYKKIKTAHIEAGLRTKNKYSPFPEELNRILTGHLSDYHFSPTERAAKNLLNEDIKDNIWMVGNTGIDALFLALKIIKQQDEERYYKFFNFIDMSKKIMLVTGHRRESFGKPFEDICYALNEIAQDFNELNIVYPVHLNPNIKRHAYSILKDIKNVHLIKPLDYSYLIWLMSRSYLVLTDSGGIQEEAPSLGKPVLVMRDITERIEGIEAGTAKLVGTNKEKIVSETMKLLTDKEEYDKMARAVNPYGDGKTSQRILGIIKDIVYI